MPPRSKRLTLRRYLLLTNHFFSCAQLLLTID
jgi:hypothetical protein